jgi:hypothetical protein
MQLHQRQEKLVRSVYTALLEKDIVLDIVLSFVGIGEHLYAAGVSRKWKERDTCCR